MDLNTFILLCILLVVMGIGGIHVYRLKEQCIKNRDTASKLVKEQIALADGKIVALEIRVQVLEDK